MALTITSVLSMATLVVGVLCIAYILEGVLHRFKIVRDRLELWRWMGAHAQLLAFFVALAALLGSLYFSDVLGYEPCKLCWYQRILMYPQTLLLGFALIRAERREIWRYVVLLSFVGMLFAGFHYISQVLDIGLPCSAIGYSASCSERFFLTYGYITIPMMALTAFVALLVLADLARNDSRRALYRPQHSA